MTYAQGIPYAMEAAMNLGFAQSGDYAFISLNLDSNQEAVQVSSLNKKKSKSQFAEL